ncbi:EspA/EspE family type VII secretion system effector [Mycobacterium sp. 155]|uniref:EspA/EspE family type VII secretion system effector n=1 Tax=Mycobacterium sp. 155 TaxID=1157943 RepID=UPI00036F0A18|nr:EspA/EspE family type VII secretion system effector [Mycobacterium sp. 155]
MAPRFPHNPGGHQPRHPRRHHPESGAAGGHHGSDIFSKISDVKDITDTVSDIVSDVKDILSGTFGGLGHLIDIGRQFFSNAPETPIIDAGLKVINGMTEMCGDGSPDTGEGFTHGADEFSDVGESLRSAAPDDSWTGGGASAYAKQNDKQQSRMQSVAETDSSIAQVLAQEADQLGVTVQQLNSAATTLQLAILPASIAMADPLGGEAASVAIQIAAVASGMAIATPTMADMVSNSMQNAQAIQQAANSYRKVASDAKLDGAPFFSPSWGGSQPRPQEQDSPVNGKPEPGSPLWTPNHTPSGANATPSTGGGTTSGGSGGNPGAGAGSSRTGGAPVNSESRTVTPASMPTGSPGGLPTGLPGGGASGVGQSSGLLGGLGSALGSLIGQAAQQGAQAAQNAQNQKAQDPDAVGEDESHDTHGRDLEKEDDANKDDQPDPKPEDAELAGAQTGPGATGERAPIHFEFDLDREQVPGPVTVTLDPDHPTAAPTVSHHPSSRPDQKGYPWEI